MTRIPSTTNAHYVYFDDRTILVSYNTPVAVCVTGSGCEQWYTTDKKYSITTTKHINKFTENAAVLPHNGFRALLPEGFGEKQ